MALNWRGGTVFAGGLLVGALGVAALYGIQPEPPRAAPPAPKVSAAPAAVVQPPAVAPIAVAVAVRQADCSFAPLLTSSGDGDGQLSLQKDLQGQSSSAVSAFILTGKEAAASGRMRDAEAAFLMACRAAEGAKVADELVVADARYQLGRHYAQVVTLGAASARRGELLQRATNLYSASLQTYRSRHGESHERTRFAAQGLAAVQQLGGATMGNVAAAPPMAEKAKPVEAPKVVTAPAAVQPPRAIQPPMVAVQPPRAIEPPMAIQPPRVVTAPRPVEAKVAVASTPSAPPPVAPARPSFDCRAARSTAEKLICGDEELARLDRDLSRVYQRAKQAAPDARAFQRDSDAQWRRREDNCRDRECLRQWYAERREQLTAAASQPTPAARPAPVQREEPAERPAPMARVPAPVPAARAIVAPVDSSPGTASGSVGQPD